MAPHSSTLAWKIPWMEEPCGLQSMGSLRARHDWTTSLSYFTFMHWRRKWQPTPVENPRDGGAWWAAISGVTQSRTWLKWLSSSSSSSFTHTLLFRDLPRHFSPAHYWPALTVSLPVSVSLFCFPAFLPFLPASLTYALTRPHLSSSLNRESVSLQCGCLPGIMEMVKNSVVRGEANSEWGSSFSLIAPQTPSSCSTPSGWGQGARD